MKGVVKVGAVDASEHQQLGGRFGVKGFPTIKIFGEDKKKPTDYSGKWWGKLASLKYGMDSLLCSSMVS